MTDNNPIVEVDETLLEKIEREGQFCTLGLYIQRPGVVYACRINQTFANLDSVSQFIFDGGIGNIENVKDGMTVVISSIGWTGY